MPLSAIAKAAAAALLAALVAIPPVALAAAGGRSAEHANDHAADGLERAAEPRSTEDSNATNESATDAGDHGPPWAVPDHPGREGLLNALAHVAERMRAFFQAILGGTHPRDAHPSNETAA